MLSIAPLALAASLALTSCSNSPSLENQTKLIEYEECLRFASDSVLASRERIQELAPNASIEDKLKMAIITEEDYIDFFEKNLLSRCLVYRP